MARGSGSTVFLVVAILLGLSAYAATATDPASAAVERSTPKVPNVNWEPDAKAARNYARGRLGGVSFAITEVDGRLRDFHAGRREIMASTFKAMVLAAYLRRNSVEDRALTAPEKGLLSPMIRASDNNATTQLRNTVGMAAINRLAKKAGMRSFSQSIRWGLSKTSARDQARFMQHYESFIPKRHQSYARRLLATIVPSQRWGVARARPTGWNIHFKGGWGVLGVNHQVGFLKRNRCRVGFAILTQSSSSHGYGTQTLQGVASRLFRGLGKLRIRRACG